MALSASERVKRYRERKKAKGEKAAHSFSLDQSTGELVDLYAQVVGTSKAEVLRVIFMRGLMEAIPAHDIGVDEYKAQLLRIRDRANEEPGDRQFLDEMYSLIKSGYELTRDVVLDNSQGKDDHE